MRSMLVLCVSTAVLLLASPATALAQKVDVKPPPKNFEMRTVRVGNTFQGIRFKPATGETWLINGRMWDKIEETGAVPAGDYDIFMVATEQDFTAFRFDHLTGATWHLQNRKWVKVQEPGQVNLGPAGSPVAGLPPLERGEKRPAVSGPGSTTLRRAR
jgi:hypothetical protein